MDVLDIGIVVIVWLNIAALAGACAVAAGRSDRRERRFRAVETPEAQSVPDPQPVRVGTRQALRTERRTGSDRRVRAGVRLRSGSTY